MNLLIIDRLDSWHVTDITRAAQQLHNISTATYNDLAAEFHNCTFNQLCHENSTRDSSSARKDSTNRTQVSSNLRTQNANSPQTTFTIAGQPIQAFDAVFTRSMPTSSLEQIVFRMDCLNQLEHQYDIPVINPAKTIESCVDKYLSLELLRQFNLPVPETCVCQTADQAIDFFEACDNKTVLKPIFGSQGRGLVLLDNLESAMKHFYEAEAQQKVIYQQRFLQHGGSDIRVLVVGADVYAIQRSRPGHWITNASQGATCTPYKLNDELRELAITASHSQGAFVAGVDIAFEYGQPYVLEINANPSWKHLSKTLEIDISAKVLRLINNLSSPNPLIA